MHTLLPRLKSMVRHSCIIEYVQERACVTCAEQSCSTRVCTRLPERLLCNRAIVSHRIHKQLGSTAGQALVALDEAALRDDLGV
jgi:hypothetical protein